MTRQICFALASMLVAQPTLAETVRLADNVRVNLKERDGNEVRTVAVADSGRSGTPLLYALHATAAKAQERGFTRIAVTAISDCGIVRMHGMPMYQQCRVLAQLVGPNESARADNLADVRYLDVARVLAQPLP